MDKETGVRREGKVQSLFSCYPQRRGARKMVLKSSVWISAVAGMTEFLELAILMRPFT
jgi:hypothetical protein